MRRARLQTAKWTMHRPKLIAPSTICKGRSAAVSRPLTRAAFLKRVDLQLDHAKVQDMAKALAKVAGIPIKVDRGVPADASTTLTMDVQGVPVANVLEAIATKTDLMIAPDGDGVILKKWAHLNGRTFRDPHRALEQRMGRSPTLWDLAELGVTLADRFRPDGFAGGGPFFGGAPGQMTLVIRARTPFFTPGAAPGANPFGNPGQNNFGGPGGSSRPKSIPGPGGQGPNPSAGRVLA